MPLLRNIETDQRFLTYLPVNKKINDEFLTDSPAIEIYREWLAEMIESRRQKNLYFVRISLAKTRSQSDEVLYLPGSDAPFQLIVKPEPEVPLGIAPLMPQQTIKPDLTRKLNQWFRLAFWRACQLVMDREFGFPAIELHSDSPAVVLRIGLRDESLRFVHQLSIEAQNEWNPHANRPPLDELPIEEIRKRAGVPK